MPTFRGAIKSTQEQWWYNSKGETSTSGKFLYGTKFTVSEAKARKQFVPKPALDERAPLESQLNTRLDTGNVQEHVYRPATMDSTLRIIVYTDQIRHQVSWLGGLCNNGQHGERKMIDQELERTWGRRAIG